MIRGGTCYASRPSSAEFQPHPARLGLRVDDSRLTGRHIQAVGNVRYCRDQGGGIASASGTAERSVANELANGVPQTHDRPSLVSMMNLVDVASEVVVPALRAVFKDGELTGFELIVTDDVEGTVALSVTAQGETFKYPVIQGDVPGMGAEEWSENLRSLLVDFVAESGFGWGENRDVR